MKQRSGNYAPQSVRHAAQWTALTLSAVYLLLLSWGLNPAGLRAGQESGQQAYVTYMNKLAPCSNAGPILADHPEFFEPIIGTPCFEAPGVINDQGADLAVRSWRFSNNARGFIEMVNRLRAGQTALIVVHPWGIDDGQGWRTPEPAGTADFLTPEKNQVVERHERNVLNPFIKSLRGRVKMVMYSLPGNEDPIRKKLYRSMDSQPTEAERLEGKKELAAKLNNFSYRGEGILPELKLSANEPLVDYFRLFPGIDAGDRYDPPGFWKLPIPVTKAIDIEPGDIVIYDQPGYGPLKQFLRQQGIRHILLAGYATDECYKKTTAGYDNLSRDFDVFLVGDATLAEFPSNSSPRFATNAAISRAADDHMITQIAWIK